MECIFPGRVVVAPGSDWSGSPSFAAQLREEAGVDFDFEFGVQHVLERNHLPLPSDLKGRPLPFVGRVPEGQETEIAGRLARVRQVDAAIPDYLVRPGGPVAPFAINSSVLDQVIQDIHAQPGDLQCGRGCTVGLLDLGIDSNLVPSANLGPKQYDAVKPDAPTSLTDTIGHGTLVAHIVSKVAPGATLISIKTFEQTGAISSVISALYLAHAVGCDVLNLSFSVSCAPIPCYVCQSPTPAAANIEQLDLFFATYMKLIPNTILIAAAGNNARHLELPAAFKRIIAVGSFDYDTKTAISSFQQVPPDRFVLAPGGQGVQGKAFAEGPGFAGPKYLYGTSFATGFVTGFAAKVVCGLKNSHCGTPRKGPPMAAYGSGPLANVLGEISAHALRNWPGFDLDLHGLGAIQF